MNGRKAKALRKLARYSVTSDRPELPAGGLHQQAVLPKEHPRKKAKFLKDRYASVPLAHTLKRMHGSTKLVEAIDKGIEAGALNGLPKET